MNEEDYKRILEEALDPIKKQLGDPKSGLKRINEKLDALWDQTMRLTENSEDVKDAIKSQTAALSHTNDNLEKVDKRLNKVESHLGIVPPPELTITR